MKTLIFIISIFAFAFSISAQNDCPTISVTSPDSITPIGDSMTFTANLSGGSYDKINYEWTISSGTLTSGQNTSRITVATNADLAGQTITVVVKISGLPQECKNEASAAGEVAPAVPVCILPRIIDDYGKLLWVDEKVRLENVAVELINDNDSIAYFIIQTKGKNRSQFLKSRVTKISKYLFDKYKISNERIIIIDAGSDVDNTRIYVLPKGILPPNY